MRLAGRIAALCILALVLPAQAASDRATVARDLLLEAERALLRAANGADRGAALAKAVEANEAALSAIRASLRHLAAESGRLADEMADERKRLAGFLTALQTISRTPTSAMVLHPEGAASAARAALLLGDLAPRIEAEARALARRMEGLRKLRLRQEIARAEARGTLAALQALRVESARSLKGGQRVGARDALRRQAAEAAQRARDIEALANLQDVGLGALAPGDFEARRGRLLAPVEGDIVGLFGGVDPWGRTGTGITFRAPAYSEVIAPADGTIRFAGELVDYGKVVILEPADGWLFVFAGLGRTSRRVGETVLTGDRLGDLGGPLPSSEEFLLEARGQVPQIRTNDLYLELRRSGEPLDPAPWFGTTAG